MERLTYVAPKTRLVVVRTQGVICGSQDGFNATYHTENFGVDTDEDI